MGPNAEARQLDGWEARLNSARAHECDGANSSRGAAAWPMAARAQQRNLPLIGYLSPGPAEAAAAPPFFEGLAETGYVVGRNISVEYRWADDLSQMPTLVADIIRLRPAIIRAVGSAAALAAKSATSTIPIVFGIGDEPVRLGLVAALDRPGGNLTGATNLNVELEEKRFAMADKIMPAAQIIAALIDSKNPGADRQAEDIRRAAKTLGRDIRILYAASDSEIDDAFTRILREKLGGLFVAADQYFVNRRLQIVTLANHYAIPAFYSRREFADAGGLVSYGTLRGESLRQEGVYIGRILKGERPADLPLVQAVRFELVINLKTAMRLGITLPTTILALADAVIE
jgi:putative tryptophan/tyrosine transport system substrate-binding protein